jgi:hypothetical protein
VRRPRSIGIWISNWQRSDLPLPARIVVAARNLALRVVRRDTCCGHEGAPGC